MESRTKSYSWLAWVFPIVLFCQGCAHGIVHQRAPITKNTIPASHLPLEMTEPPKKHMVPIEWTRLRRPPVREHVIGPDDVLGVYVEEVLPAETAAPMIFFPGQQESPSVGQPIRVRSDGSIFLPLVGATKVSGLTLAAGDRQGSQRLSRETDSDRRSICDGRVDQSPHREGFRGA